MAPSKPVMTSAGTVVFGLFWKSSVWNLYKGGVVMLAIDTRIANRMDNPSKIEQFVYPELVAVGYLMGEDIEEAIIEYLEKHGFNGDYLRAHGVFEYRRPDKHGFITTKCLTIKI